MKHFLIYTNRNKDKGMEITERIRSFLEERGQRCTIMMKQPGWQFHQEKDSEEGDTSIPSDVDCMIILGGDGTMLQGARDVKKHNIPMIGVKLGTLGYMTEIEPNQLEAALERLVLGDYAIESRMMLNCKVYMKNEQEAEGWALNDIVVSRSGSLRMIHLHVYVNGQLLYNYQADGIIISTPTGSTGYNLSAGGPIVEPKAKLLLLTPVCSHSLNQRSIVLSPEDVIEIKIPNGRDGREQELEVSFDGSHGILLQTGDIIRIVKSEKTTEIIQLNQVSFLDVLHHKLSE
jgi:NAD+ kinase